MRDLLSKISCNHKIGDYSFVQTTCPRCEGTGYYFDIMVGNHGDIEVTSGSKRLVQDILKALLEQVGSNIDDSEWGSELYKVRIIQDPTLTKAQIISSVVSSLKRLKVLMDDEDYQYGLPSNEVLSRRGIKDIQILRDTTEPRRLLIQLSLSDNSEDNIVVKTPLDNTR